MYEHYLATNERAIQQAKKAVRTFTLLRLVVFAISFAFVYASWGNTGFVFTSIFCGIALFLVAVRYSVDAKLALEKAIQTKKLLEQEQGALAGKFEAFDPGKAYLDPKHAFAHDLDLFAPNGVFAQLNRTFSELGQRKLAQQLLHGTKQRNETNEQIAYLAKNIEWTIQYRVAGSIPSRKEAVQLTVDRWTKAVHTNPAWIKPLVWLVPLVMIPAVVAFNLELIGGSIFTALLVAALYPVGKLMKSTNQWAEEMHRLAPKIQAMQEQMAFVCTLNDAPRSIVALQETFRGREKNALEALRSWNTLAKRFEFRMNLLVSIPLNLFFAWDIRQRMALVAWKQTHGVALEQWERHLAEMEVMISGATFHHNHPDVIFAQFTDSFEIHFKELRHPLLLHKHSVSNPLVFDKPAQFMILTGPNMAGKSTYLRSVGLAIVFAQAGFPVAAQQATLPEVALYSSMRTTDDLAQESSYFHAELTRLSFILRAINRGEKVFILLDEILKGTNSIDKAEGSKRFLQKLERLGAHGIIATHDLSLCALANDNPHFFNGCFDSTIADNQLSFDYTWRPGICQNMNASFLLKQMNLVD